MAKTPSPLMQWLTTPGLALTVRINRYVAPGQIESEVFEGTFVGTMAPGRRTFFVFASQGRYRMLPAGWIAEISGEIGENDMVAFMRRAEELVTDTSLSDLEKARMLNAQFPSQSVEACRSWIRRRSQKQD